MIPYRLKKYAKVTSTKIKMLTSRKPITTFWWDDVVNFGDLLTPYLLRKYGFTPIKVSKEDAQLLGVGSILQSLHETYNGIILGSGLIEEKRVSFPNAKILAVRGELTRDLIGAPVDTILGDPGLLAAIHYKDRPSVVFKYGIVPHYIDQPSLGLRAIQKKIGESALMIDVKRRPEEVFYDIARCEMIISSSLHGIIIAHSMNKHAAWIVLSDNVHGDGFKFSDYSSSLKIKIPPVFINDEESIDDIFQSMVRPDRHILEQRVIELDGVFKSLSSNV